VDLEGANLQRASLEGANLQDANLQDANLKSALDRRAIGRETAHEKALSPTQINGVLHVRTMIGHCNGWDDIICWLGAQVGRPLPSNQDQLCVQSHTPRHHG